MSYAQFSQGLLGLVIMVAWSRVDEFLREVKDLCFKHTTFHEKIKKRMNRVFFQLRMYHHILLNDYYGICCSLSLAGDVNDVPCILGGIFECWQSIKQGWIFNSHFMAFHCCCMMRQYWYMYITVDCSCVMDLFKYSWLSNNGLIMIITGSYLVHFRTVQCALNMSETKL